ncbi:hypothetical protein [Zobellella aerophila]|uniref:Uncharacterized protein n=1 Tax=Zobellella aerophila TaxID=870480 RepID=A0ABP6W905_9GAMM
MATLEGYDIEKSKVSSLLISQMCKYEEQGGNLASIAKSISSVERGACSFVKGGEKFKGEILGCFYKVHYFDSEHFFKNISNEIIYQGGSKKGEFKPDFFKKLSQLGFEHASSDGDFVKISNDVAKFVVDGINERAGRGAVTGEWVIYRENEGERFYCTLAYHHEDDAVIFKRLQDNNLI